MRGIFASLSATLLASAVLAAPAAAQQAPAPADQPASNPADEWHFEIAPRIWIRTNNVVSGPAFVCGGGVLVCSVSKQALSFVMAGASLTIQPPTLQVGPHPTDFVITSYAGPSQSLTSESLVLIDGSAGAVENFVFRGSRVDSEILGRTALDPSRAVRAVYGVRWLRNDDEVSVNVLAPPIGGVGTFRTETDGVLGEGGVQFAVPIGETPHSVFGGAILGLGKANTVKWVSEAFLDASLGYSYAVSDRFAPYLRYRFQVFAPFAGGSFTTNLQVVHGPEVGFSLRF